MNIARPSDKCAKCGKTVYPTEKISVDDKSLMHKVKNNDKPTFCCGRSEKFDNLRYFLKFKYQSRDFDTPSTKVIV
jgi:hypothetical protein